ncbi:MAG: bifunctional alpha,alpha-trehalose-phosphate synthase (UDP-forming)/trehalose-phosphatase [Myxococcaceae bacterium]|nr:bifunctional alpha,alpha-trehalose-phosphate synthase (UDP-forming)/trehalose-phosphatase [Myxococcaceae bacterium]MCI0669817.1 bifunctional alpha,alpha-trehalose-phosphate synthase (UDP-forming)/trehalose-phosphatase [Myxococcaceae bacterium]
MSRLLLVSNRLPVTVKLESGQVQVARSAGGLATGLSGPHEQSQGLWLGWPGDVTRLGPTQVADLESRLLDLRCVPLYLTAAEVNRFYEGFSNRVLWPLCHYMLDRIPLHSRDWEVYRRVNQRFADKVAEHHQPGDTIWVHDYQLMLVPRMLRERLPDARIGFFLHIPFPSSEVFRTLPWREEVLRGLLGADLVGFHTPSYVRHFATSLLRLLGLEVDGDEVHDEGRTVRLGAFPMGIDAREFERLAETPAVLAEAGNLRVRNPELKLVLGVDRLDYTKGIPRRLLSFERLLEREPSLRGKVRLIQVAVPSRTGVEDYARYREQVDELVGRINGTYGTVNHTPIHYLYRSIPQNTLVALYRGADVMYVTPLRDGMNLVAKEFVASRPDGDGVLVLSEFAGVAGELADALKVNPYDVEGMARALHEALHMPEAERRSRMGRMRARVLEHDVHRWVHGFLGALKAVTAPEEAPAARPATREELAALVSRLRKAPARVLLLDYDGTLVPLQPRPEMAAPTPELLSILGAVARVPGTFVHVVSGRPRTVLEEWLGQLPVGLHAEHGLWSRLSPDAPWEMIADLDLSWKPRALQLMRQYADRTPGALVEEKTASVAWHYRLADPEFGVQQARELRMHLAELFTASGLEVLPGNKIVELRPRGVHKGRIVERVRACTPADALLVAFGDDRTDEDLFAALPEGAVAVAVGQRPSRAKVRLRDPAAVLNLLRALH